MSPKVIRFDVTPNPNALKCVLNTRVAHAPRSYLTSADADPAADPLAAAIFNVPGVRNLLMVDDWITVGKDPDAAWPPIRSAVKEIVERQDDG